MFLCSNNNDADMDWILKCEDHNDIVFSTKHFQSCSNANLPYFIFSCILFYNNTWQGNPVFGGAVLKSGFIMPTTNPNSDVSRAILDNGADALCVQ